MWQNEKWTVMCKLNRTESAFTEKRSDVRYDPLIDIVTGTDVEEINKAFEDGRQQGRWLVPAGSAPPLKRMVAVPVVGGVNDEVSKQDESPPSRQHTETNAPHPLRVLVYVVRYLGPLADYSPRNPRSTPPLANPELSESSLTRILRN